jgi:tripartite-type tricarboxylate transporter receptor subunit TctC
MSWFRFTTRKGVPAEAVNGMAAAVNKALEREDVKARLLKLALYPGYQRPADFAAQIKKDQASFKAVLTKLGMLKAK